MAQTSSLFGILYGTITPLFLIIGAAWLVGQKVRVEPRTLSRLIIYLFSPALVFTSIARSDLALGEIGAILVGALLLCAGLATLASGAARLLRFERRLASTFVLTVFIMNAVNFGYPFVEFAFGADGLAVAVVYGVGLSLAANTLGIYVASRGRYSARDSLRNVLITPLPYALVTAVVVNYFNLTLPEPILRATGVLSAAAVPCALVILGLQLRSASLRGRLLPIGATAVARFVVAPVFALGLAALFGFGGLTRQVFVLEASMPTGVFSGVLATEYGVDAEYATAAILVTTLLSIVTLSVLLLLLG